MPRSLGRTALRACRSAIDQQRVSVHACTSACSSLDRLDAGCQEARDCSTAACGVTPPHHQQRPSAFASTAAAPWIDGRSYSSNAAPLSEIQFHRVAGHTLEALLEDLELVIDERGLDAADIEYGQGVLTLKLGDSGTYVINKQGPNQQLWLSSPVSGPARYDYEGGDWLYRRDGHLLHDKLEAELGELMDGPVSLSRPTSGTTDP